MILIVDLNQRKLYTSIQRLVSFLLSPDSHRQYGTEIGCQLSFAQVVSFFTGKVKVVSFSASKSVGRSSMPAGYLSREEQQFRETSPFIPGSTHLSLNSAEKTVLTISISVFQRGKKGATQRKKEEWGLASLTIREKMGKFFGGAGNPTALSIRTKPTLEVSNHA